MIWKIFVEILTAGTWISIGWGLHALWPRVEKSRAPWWNPSAWISSILFEVASRAPNDLDMIAAAAYGVVEVCGIKRAVKPLFSALENWLRSKLHEE